MKKIFAILSLFFVSNLISQEINWISMDKALELQKKVPKNIIMDVYTGTFLGQHALLYSILCFTTNVFQRRLSWYTFTNQSINLLPIFAFALFIDAIVRYAAEGTTAPWWFVFRPVLESITAFFVGWVMLKLINRRSSSALTARRSSPRVKI